MRIHGRKRAQSWRLSVKTEQIQFYKKRETTDKFKAKVFPQCVITSQVATDEAHACQ